MTVDQLSPSAASIDLATVLQQLTNPSSTLKPFADEVVEFCHNFSRRLFSDGEAKRFPELQSLAFWMRKSEVTRMRHEFESLNRPPVRLVPRGLAFHIPPTNVDTISIYSLLLALLTGNRNIVRLSPRAAVQSHILVRLLNACLSEASAPLQDGTVVISYGHDAGITAAISAVCDVRVVWGGDNTVNAIRTVPLPPHGREIAFPDRYSLSAIESSAYEQAGESARRDLATRFFNDVFWFDQMACSSPHLIAWVGEDAEPCARDFYQRVGAYARSRGLIAEPATRIAKYTFAARAILDRPVVHYGNYENELSVLSLANVRALHREHSGGGLLYQIALRDLSELAPHIERRDQTLTHYGFQKHQLEQFVELLNGRGIDRIVPIGEALTFRRHWDGMDLFSELTRAVYIA